MATVKRVTDSGIRIIEQELNEYQSLLKGTVRRRDEEHREAISYLKSGAFELAKKLGVYCSCKPTQTSKRDYCQCKRQPPSRKKVGRTLSGVSLDLAGNCRDKAGKFVPVRNCTGRGPATKRKPKRKPKKKAAKRR